AIAIRGTGAVKVADMAQLEAMTLDIYRKAQTAATEKYRVLGTLSNVLTLNRLAAMPTRNFQSSVFEGAEKISGEYLLEHYQPKIVACGACPIACEHIFQLGEGPYAGTKVRVEYESLYALGPLCGIDDAQIIIRACDLCDSYGMDTLSTGGCIAWAMECYERGLLSKQDTGGVELTFGNGQAVLAMINQIGNNEGLGRLLSQGVRRASAEVGHGSEYWAMHSKGLEIPGYDPRSMKTMALGYATGLRGACHNRSAAYEVDMMPDIDRLKGDRERGAMAVVKENFAAVLDSLIICKFLRRCFDAFYEDIAKMYTLVTGIEFSQSDIALVGERVNNLKKVFNIREGWKPGDDWLPPRIFRDALPDGVAKGVVLTENELREMIEGYYEARGWTREGLVPEAKLRELGIEAMATKMKNMVARK
ncbi:MAG: aldehyde:ferredoxin oxidoreductase, partial [Chloroflexi bacterium]|nr:aldehyde:ferredoxin oxidoreductase [Chloroflexota bacterium]